MEKGEFETQEKLEKSLDEIISSEKTGKGEPRYLDLCVFN
jgi:hypothetical protein